MSTGLSFYFLHSDFVKLQDVNVVVFLLLLFVPKATIIKSLSAPPSPSLSAKSKFRVGDASCSIAILH